MSTRCNISVQQPDGTFTGIYCHSDGYREHTGELLLRCFNTEEAANALVALGDISCIGRDGSVDAYHRDMHEAWEDCNPVTTETLDEMVRRFDSAVNGWFYSWFGGRWHFVSPGETAWKPLCSPTSKPS